MQIIVTDSADTDIPAITAIYGREVRLSSASFELEAPDEAEVTRRRAAILAGGYPYLVARAGGAVAGYSYAGPYRPRPGYRFTVENSIYVSPDFRGQGIAGRLLSALIHRCEAGGYRLMVAVIGNSANAASIALHARLGFRHAGVLPAVGWKHGRWLDSVMMTRPLGPGATTPPDTDAAP